MCVFVCVENNVWVCVFLCTTVFCVSVYICIYLYLCVNSFLTPIHSFVQIKLCGSWFAIVEHIQK